jgi:hypothetical protein
MAARRWCCVVIWADESEITKWTKVMRDADLNPAD